MTTLRWIWSVSFALSVVTCSATASSQQLAHDTLAPFDSEPRIRAVHRAALMATGLRPSSEHNWGRRARLAHLLPEVQGEVAWLDQRDIETTYREDIESDGREVVTDSRNDYVDDARLRGVYAIRLDWDLSGLVFDPDELDAARATERRHVARAELLQLVTRVYFERRRCQLELVMLPTEDVGKRLDATLCVQRGTAELDAYTGGWFSGRLDQRDEFRTGSRTPQGGTR